MPDKKPAPLNIDAVLNHFGGPVNLARLAKIHNIALAYHGVRKWPNRGFVTPEGLAKLAQLGDAIGKPFVVRKFRRA